MILRNVTTLSKIYKCYKKTINSRNNGQNKNSISNILEIWIFVLKDKMFELEAKNLE